MLGATGDGAQTHRMDKEKLSSATRFLIGNWKCRKSLDEARAWLDEFGRGYKPVAGVEVAVAPPMVLLVPLAEYIEEIGLQQFSLAAQDISPFPAGRYTGATAADMVRNLCRYAIIGHSERRRYFHETALDVVNKAAEAADAGIAPIICVDEKNAISQLSALGHIDSDNLLIAYSPADAGDYRQLQDPEKIGRAISYISQVYPNRPIIYGGGVGAGNHQQITGIAGVAGLFVGDASLQPQSFLTIVQTMQRLAAPA